VSCVVAGREAVVHGMNTMDLSTLTADAAGASAHDARLPQLVPALQLSPNQLRRISAGLATYNALLEPVARARARLQAEAAADGLAQLSIGDVGSNGSAGAHGASSDGDGGAVDTTTAAGAAASSARTMAHLHPIGHRQERLQAERARVIRLQQLMQKESMLRMAGAAWFLGCLTLRQASKLAVVSWPWHCRPLLLAAAAAKWHREQQQQQEEVQLQQQQQQQQQQQEVQLQQQQEVQQQQQTHDGNSMVTG
jgi:hypothetical protein